MRRLIGILVGVASVLATAAAGHDPELPDASPPAGDVLGEVEDRAVELIETFDESERGRVLRSFDSGERREWSYLPGSRTGLPLAEMSARQRRLSHRLLRALLSSEGYLEVTGIIKLEEVLRAMETMGFRRNPEAYFLAFFGSPGSSEPWGLRFEGHHVSINYTSVPGGSAGGGSGSGVRVSTTPLFFGANPAEVQAGTWAGYRVLADEEDLARELLESLDPGRRAQAVVADEAPRDIETRMDPAARRLAPEGLSAAAMTADQRALLWRLVEEYVGHLAPGLAEAELARLRGAGLDGLSFAWAGGAEPGEPHYYRIQGETLLIEYDNTQNGANHVHTVWRDLERDFGEDLLGKHYERSGHHRQEDSGRAVAPGGSGDRERSSGDGD